jgi:multidrug efflux pump
VRGFITTPLERSSRPPTASTTSSRKPAERLDHPRAPALNYDANRALSEISAKVNQVRGDLPPEAEIPVINIETADSQFASAYLSFSSQFLKQNEITDYLVRVVQPRLSAIEGVQRADILGAAPSPCASGSRRTGWRRSVSPSQVRRRSPPTTTWRPWARPRAPWSRSTSPPTPTSARCDEFQQAGGAPERRRRGRLGDVADVVLGAEDYDTAVNFTGQTAVFIGIWALPNANSLDVIGRVRSEMANLQKEIPEQIQAVDRLRRHQLHQECAIHEVSKTLGETLLIVVL